VSPDGHVTVLTSVTEARRALDQARAGGARVGLVPTMGYLHQGHASLMARARAECDLVIVTIFVNPLQVAPGEDLAAYPRDLARDLDMAALEGVDLVLAPSVEEMYPEPMRTTVAVPSLSTSWEGATRPTHFSGVATVVTKLFGIAAPCRAYFGEKDFQQLVIVTRLAADLSLPVEVVGCPIVREADGLALSSRNLYLSPAERAAAAVLHQALLAGRVAVREGERRPAAVTDRVAELIRAEPLAELDYVALVRPDTLEVPDQVTGELRLLVAARFGRPRLLDNLSVLASEQD
jgi:pantoate--beta-alanine ligase